MKAPIEFTVSIARTALDYGRDYSMSPLDLVSEIVDEYSADLGWSRSDEKEVYSKAMNMLRDHLKQTA